MKCSPWIAAFVLVLAHAPRATAQDDRTVTFQTAMQKVAQGQVDQAIHMLDSLVARHDDFARGWAGLGQAHRANGNHQASLTAFRKSVDLTPGNPNMLYNLGVAYALVDDADGAFEWLLRAKASNAVNLTNFDGLPAADHVRDDSRYPSLFPSEEEMSDPFVEGGTLLQEWRGESSRDQFGWIARNIGDVDGDGINDLVTSAPTRSEGAARAGKVYAFSGQTGELLWSKTGTVANGQLGMGIESAGDVNADGIPDVIAAAPYDNHVFVYSGRDGKELFSIAGPDSTGVFGSHVKGIGDANGDGYGDLLVGEPFQIWGAPIKGGSLNHPGRAHVYSGKDGSKLLSLSGEKAGDAFGRAVAGQTVNGTTYFMVGAPNAGPNSSGRTYVYDDLSGDPLFVIDPENSGVNLGGMFLSIIGDVNADGTPDMYASDWADAALGASTGRIYVHSGADGQRLHVLGGEAAGDGFGIGISDAGDVNQDGYDDLIVAAWQYAGAAPSGGKLYVHSGKTGELLRTFTGKIPGETLGFDTTGMGDVNGDGVVDFLITSAWSVVNGFQSGRIFILSGK